MKRGKPNRRPPKTGNYLGWQEFTVKPIENEPDPAKMIDVFMDGSKHWILTAEPRAGDPDPATMIDVWPGPPPIERTVKPIESEPDPATPIAAQPSPTG